MSISQNFPVANPALLLDFANTKSLDPRVTFTRASTGTYYDEDTNAMAEQNLQRYSEEFDNGGWSKTSLTVTANDLIAPDGTTTAEKIIGVAATSVHFIANAGLLFSIPANTTGTFSLYVNKGTRRYIQLGLDSGSDGAFANFDLDTTAVTLTGTYGATGTYVNSSITNVGNGWFRISVTSSNTAGMFRVALVFITSGTAVWAESYLSSPSEYMYFWGAQVEMRTAPGGYIKTTTQPLTTYIPVLLTAQANQARLQHDPITRESLGLLIEEQRTNLALQSQNFTTSWNVEDLTVTANTQVSPDGTLTAETITENTANTDHRVKSTAISFVSGTTYSISVFAKNGNANFIQIVLPTTAFGGLYANFDISTGTVGSFNTTSATITQVGNGWFRLVVTATATSSVSVDFSIGLADSATLARLAAYTGTSRFAYIWGAQVEAGAFPTSYIPTTVSTATRSADAANMSGTNFSQWYSVNEGTVYSEFTGRTARVIVHISDNSFANRLPQLAIGSANNYEGYIVVNGNVTATLIPAGTHVFGTFAKMTFGYGSNGCTAVVNSGTISTASSVTFPTIINRMDIGAFQNGASNLNGTIKKIAYYSERLSNAQLQAITS